MFYPAILRKNECRNWNISCFLYLHPKSGIQIVPILIMILVNLAICAAAVVISGQAVLKEQVVDVIRE